MTILSIRRAALAAACVLPLLVASAAPSAAGSRGAAHAADPAASAHQRVVEFWTAERRASAIPLDVVRTDPRPNKKPPWAGGGDGSDTGDTGDGGSGSSGPGTTDVVTGQKWSYGGDVAQTTGKVYFVDPGGGRYVCSGSVVNSSHGNLVATAGHCVHGSSGYMVKFAFYPGYDGGAGEAGVFTANETGDEGDLATTSTWAASEDFDDDFGLATVFQPDTTLEAAVSPAPIPTIDTTGGASGFHSAFGYPAAKKYKGHELIWCQGSVRSDIDRNNTMTMACDMTGGSSGGPWYAGYDYTSVTGPTLASVNSYGYASLNGYMFGPIFDAPEAALYSSVD